MSRESPAGHAMVSVAARGSWHSGGWGEYKGSGCLSEEEVPRSFLLVVFPPL